MKEIKFAADDSLIAQLNDASQSANVNRATFIREAVQFRLNANQLPSHSKLPTATTCCVKKQRTASSPVLRLTISWQ